MFFLGLLCANFIRIDQELKRFVLPNGKEIMFHGTNVVQKEYPYYPVTHGKMDYNTTVVDEDIAFMKRNGFNLVRLGVMWPGVFPTQEKPDETYLQEIEKLVNKFGAAGIYSMLDMHQDVVTTYGCGEGAPDWAVPWEIEGTQPFPMPLTDAPFERDPVTHKFTRTKCREFMFAEYYNSDYVSEVLERMFLGKTLKNGTGAEINLREELIRFWEAVATRFRLNQFVFGYDLINEPTVVNKVTNPRLSVKKFEAEVLQPFYTKVIEKLIQIDSEHIIFFEPTVIEIFATGFQKHGPGAGIIAPEKQCYSWHMYCETIDENDDPTLPLELCRFVDHFWSGMRMHFSKQMDLHQIVNEFGALPNTPELMDLMSGQMEILAKNKISWAYWAYKSFGDITTAFSESSKENEGLFYPDGSIQEMKVRVLTHPFVQICAGTIKEHKFSYKDKKLTFKFITGKVGEQSEIPIGDLWMTFGKYSKVTGAAKVVKTANKVFIINKAEGQEVNIELW